LLQVLHWEAADIQLFHQSAWIDYSMEENKSLNNRADGNPTNDPIEKPAPNGAGLY